MSHSEGAYLGGIRTVEDLRQRCRVDDITGCWHWSMCMTQGSPRVHFGLNGKQLVMRGRRAALTIAAGKLLHASHKAWARDFCHAADCVNPEHARSGTRQQHGAYMVRTGRSKTTAKSLSAIRAGRSRRRLTPDQARLIRQSNAPILALAEQFGVSAYAVWCVRAGKTWREAAANSSVFTWRPAA